MNTLTRLAFAALLAGAVPAQAQMYKCIDGKGRASYAQTPGPGCALTGGSVAGKQGPGPGAKGGPAPESKGADKGKGKGTAARQPSPPAETVAQASGRCEGARQQRAWLMGPKGEAVAHRQERLAQLDQALADCSKTP